MRLLITLYNFPKAASIFDKDVCLKFYLNVLIPLTRNSLNIWM